MKYLSVLFLLFVFCLTSCGTVPFETGLLPKKFTVSLKSRQVPLGDIETQIKNTFPKTGLAKKDVKVIYFPEEDAVCLSYKTIQSYYCFLDREARELFITALNKYSQEYEERSITDNKRKTTSAYGRTGVFLIWQQFSFSKQYGMNTDITYGYLFYNNSPYFALTQKNVSYIDTDNGSREEFKSYEIVMHFTRAQAQELEALLDEELLRSHAVERIIRNGAAEADVW